MKELGTFYCVELIVALKRYIEYLDHLELDYTAKEMRKLFDWLMNSDIYLKPFNT